MATIHAEAGAGAAGCLLSWQLDFDDVANTVTVNATHTHFDGSPAPDPQQAQITLQLNSGQPISLDLLTGRLSNGAAFDGTASKIIDSGPRTRSNVRLTVGSGRGKVITFSTQYLPPA